MKLSTLIWLVLVSYSGQSFALTIDYFGQQPPTNKPQVFDFSTVVPKGYKVGNPTFSPDGKEFYFTEENSRNIYVMYREQGKWSTPVKASFSDQGHNYEPSISQDNQRLFFISSRKYGNGKFNGRIWHTSRQADGKWSSPQLFLDRKTTEGFWFPSSPSPDEVYFGATLSDSFGEGDFYHAVKKGESWQINHLPAPFNTAGYEWDPHISPDGSYMIFQSERKGGFGGTDIYVSFKQDTDWQAPINLGGIVNGPSYETAAKITPDGKYMFYILAPDEGEPVIYWLSTDVIDLLRP